MRCLRTWRRCDGCTFRRETATTEIGNAAVTAERLSVEVCELLQRLQASSDANQRRVLLERIETGNASVGEELARAETLLRDVTEATGQVVATFSEAASAVDEVDGLTEADRDGADGEDAAAGLAAAKADCERARTLLEELEGLKSEALEILERAVNVVDGMEETDTVLELLQTVEARVDQIVAAPEAVASCPDAAAEACTSTSSVLDTARRELTAARSRLEALTQRVDALRPELTTAERKVDAVDLLAGMADGYLDRIQTALDGADLCRDLARDLAQEMDRPSVPDVVGLAGAEARARIEQAGLSASFVGAGPAPDPREAYTVAAQAPGAGEQAPDGGVVTVRLYGEASSVTVPSVIGLGAAQAKAALESLGLHASLVAGAAATTPDEAFQVQHQSPAAGSAVERGDTVTVRVLGQFDPSAVLRNVDCSAWRGTEPVWDAASGGAQCVCPAGTQWSSADQRCVSTSDSNQQAGGMTDRCGQLSEAFWQLMLADRFAEAEQLLSQAVNCDFYQRGVAALQGEHNMHCQELNNQILAACLQRNVARAQALMQQAYAQRCPLSSQAMSCVNDIQRSQQIQRQQQNAQAWNQLFNTMNDLVQMQQQMNQQRHDDTADALRQNQLSNIFGSNPRVPVGDPLNSSGYQSPTDYQPPPGTSGGSSGGTSGGGGGRSAEDCLREYCPMCFNDVDLIGVSRDPQCNECRSVNHANIVACQEGRSAGPAVGTTTTYRIVCSLTDPDANGNRYCFSYGCIDPSSVMQGNWRLIRSTRSWDTCMDEANRLNSQR